jgi:RNA polymerase sigma-70 factor (ECF subfamily)
MDMLVGSYPGAAVTLDQTLEREFDERLADSSPLAFRVAHGVLHNRHDAEDVAQEALFRAYRNYDRLRDRDRFRAWLVRIAWRLAIDRIRATRRRETRETAAMIDAHYGSEQTVESLHDSREFERRLARAVDELPEKLRVVLVLGAIDGHGVREIGLLLDLPEGTVKSRLFHARKKLAERLQ